MASNDFPAPITFHGPDLAATLSLGRDGRCLLGLRRATPGLAAATLEVILQPVDHSDLPRGFAVILWEGTLTFTPGLGGESRVYLWLPSNIDWRLVSRCHYRLTFHHDQPAPPAPLEPPPPPAVPEKP